MIFDCPSCGSENGVPLSTISEDGHVLRCRKCNDAFRVFPPDDEEGGTGDVPPADDGGESTSVSAPPEPWDSPSRTVRAASLTDSGPSFVTAGRPLPVATAEHGLDPELDTTGVQPETDVFAEVDGATDGGEQDDADAAIGGQPAESSVRDSVPVLARPPTPPAPSTPGTIEPNLDEDDEPKPTARAPAPRGVLLDEPSVVLQRGPGFTRLARVAVDRLSKAPLALKAAVAVFPIALLVTLLLDPAGGKSKEAVPISIPAAPEPKTADDAIKLATDAGVAAKRADWPEIVDPEVDTKPELTKPEPTVATVATVAAESKPGIEADVPAPEGFAYVQSRVRMRSSAADKGKLVGRVKGGTLVKSYEQDGEWTLIRVMPDGAAGFVKAEYLAPTKSIAALANDIAFADCRTSKTVTTDACLTEAEKLLGACLNRCPAGGEGNTRCDKICKTAFTACGDSCRKKRKRRR